MADKIDTSGSIPQLWKDMSDTTWAPVVVAKNQDGSPILSVVATTATGFSLASGVASAQLKAANTARIGMTLQNTDAYGVYVKYGTTASATDFTVLIPAGGYWEMPKPIYTGRMDAIWIGDGAGSLYGTELT